MAQNPIVYSGSTPDTLPQGAAKINGDVGALYALCANLQAELTALQNSQAPSIVISPFSGGLPYGGGVLTVSGVYGGAAPTGISYSLDGSSTYTPATEAVSIGNQTFSFTIPAPVAGAHTIKVQETNATAVVSASVSFTIPTASAPAHYLSLTGAAGQGATASIASGTPNLPTDGLFDFAVYLNLSNYNPGQAYIVDTTSFGNAYGFAVGFLSGGDVYVAIASSAGHPSSASSSATLASASPSPSLGIWLHIVANVNPTANAAITDRTGVSRPAGSCSFYTSPDGANRTLLGTTQTLSYPGTSTAATHGNALRIGGYSSDGLYVPTAGVAGDIYKAQLYSSAGVLLFDPDFTGLSTGATTFTDGSATPLTWTINSPATEA